jgi:hypothetical protein
MLFTGHVSYSPKVTGFQSFFIKRAYLWTCFFTATCHWLLGTRKLSSLLPTSHGNSIFGECRVPSGFVMPGPRPVDQATEDAVRRHRAAWETFCTIFNYTVATVTVYQTDYTEEDERLAGKASSQEVLLYELDSTFGSEDWLKITHPYLKFVLADGKRIWAEVKALHLRRYADRLSCQINADFSVEKTDE